MISVDLACCMINRRLRQPPPPPQNIQQYNRDSNINNQINRNYSPQRY